MVAPSSYPRPGAYINEQLLPLTTSGNNVPGQAVAAFANAYNIGPTIPTFCASWQNFISLYGNFNVSNNNPLHFAVYSYFVNGGTGCFVLRVPNSDAVPSTQSLKDLGGATVFTVTAAQQQIVSAGGWGNNVYVEIVALNASTAHFNLNVYYIPGGAGNVGPGFLVETFLNISTNQADPRYVANIVNSPVSGSQFIQLTGGLPYVAGVTDFQTQVATALSGGSDGVSAPTGTFTTIVQTNLDNYCTGQILNLNVPGGFNAAGSMNTNTNINTLVAWGAAREDVFVLVDGPLPNFPESSAAVVAAYTNMITGGASLAPSSFVGVYGPYLLVQDPSSANVGATRYVGPSGSLLGMWAFTDTLVGPQQVAAGTQFGQISCLGLEVYFTPSDLNNLFPVNINAIKKIPGFGFCAFGARTLLQGYPSMYIPIRRVLMKIEHDAIVLTQFAMFQPNTPTLWQNVTTVLSNYLTTRALAGMLGTTNPATAYSIVCDATNNPPSSAQSGILNISISVALGSPVEIIVINISQLTQGTITNSNPGGTAQ